jgi:prepilin-type N-terminal cleavage/methylation domain-containing protein
MNTRLSKKEKGFTLVELMVSMTIFTILITVGIGAVLNATSQYYIAANMRSIMDNLNFVMEDMSRNIRTATAVHCGGSPGSHIGGSDFIPASCATTPSGKLVVATISGENITYAITPSSFEASPNRIFKTVGDAGPEQAITPAEITVDFMKSGFTVRGAEPGDGIQPDVTIRLAGTVRYKNIDSPFAIQNSITLRPLDL